MATKKRTVKKQEFLPLTQAEVNKYRETATVYPLGSIIPVWLAHARGDKRFPKVGRTDGNHWGSGNSYTYVGDRLYLGSTLLAVQMRGKPRYIMLARTFDSFVAQQLGWNTPKNGPVVWTQSDMLPRSSVGKMVHIASRVKRVESRARADGKFADLERRLAAIAAYHDPANNDIRKKYAELRSAHSKAAVAFDDVFYSAPRNGDEVVAALGHKHEPGMMYKRLNDFPNTYTARLALPPVEKRYYANHGAAYPPIGEWTAPLNNVRLCNTGYHLIPGTKFIETWSSHGPHLFVAEGAGASDPPNPTEDRHDKIAYEKVRLVKYVGNIDSITREMLVKARGVDIAEVEKLRKASEKAEKEVQDFYQKHKAVLEARPDMF